MEAQLDSKRERLQVRDRETGNVTEEFIYGRAALEFAYRTFLGRTLISILPHGMLSRVCGFFNRRPASRAKIPAFVSGLGIDASEAELPLSEYRSLDDFFCRRLKPDVRPVDTSADRLVSPADGRILVVSHIHDHEFTIKSCSVRLQKLLSDPSEAKRYSHGSAVVVRLAPCDYHRFHFPDSGEASESRLIPGRLHSVHPFALLSGARSFRNKRTITVLESAGFGRLTIVEVGAFAVGSIVQTYKPGAVERGQEKGYFRFGGSTLVVLIPPNRVIFDEDLVAASNEGLETFVKMGTSIGSATSI